MASSSIRYALHTPLPDGREALGETAKVAEPLGTRALRFASLTVTRKRGEVSIAV